MFKGFSLGLVRAKYLYTRVKDPDPALVLAKIDPNVLEPTVPD
jgi:hypothetical protein